MSRVTLSFAAVVCLLAAGGWAQQTLRGVVVDSTGAVVAGAGIAVTTSSGTIHTVTSPDGKFSAEVAPPASVQASKAGWQTASAPWSGEAELRLVLQVAAAQQQVVVSATRTPAALADVASSISALTARDAAAAPQLSIDDLLRQVPGFSLLRRSDSRTANPTSQGVSLRGLGASGASRALVLLDGIPLNDPFGGWIYWDRIPTAEVETVEVLRSGGSALYGNGALAGVVSAESAPIAAHALTFDGSTGGQGTDLGSLAASTVRGRWGIAAALQALRTDGYFPTPESQRGAADRAADERYANGRVRFDRHFGFGSGFVAASLFNESRQNGTALQTNSTRLAEVSAGLEAAALGGNLSGRAYGSGERFNQSFSSLSADRNTETLLRWQAVPAQQAGGSAQWVRSLGRRHVLVLGGDAWQVRGESDEVGFTRAAPSSHIVVGGHQLATGGFVEDIAQIGPRLHITAAMRIDSWRNYDAVSMTLPVAPTGSPNRAPFPDRSDTKVSPSVGAALKLSNFVTLVAAGYGSFRAPSLNELYRGFRLGNVQTQANDALRAERLWGGEGGVRIGSGSRFARATFFRNEIHDAVGNRTLSVTPALITRQRQNIGTLDAKGVEVEAQAGVGKGIWTRIGYEFVDSTVARALDPVLAGLRIPQVPRHTVSGTVGYTSRHWSGSVTNRYVGKQFDDDLNLFPLPGYFTADAVVHYRIGERSEVFVAAENLLDRGFVIALTPNQQLGAPRLVRVGLRVNWRPRVP